MQPDRDKMPVTMTAVFCLLLLWIRVRTVLRILGCLTVAMMMITTWARQVVTPRKRSSPSLFFLLFCYSRVGLFILDANIATGLFNQFFVQSFNSNYNINDGFVR